ncbi:uncharacterized protein HaLaN_21887 [Haematococcus lacustris]|uniref:AAR2 N-terminal domain-containing protein n=1 Tax=Haematococcus lacustris TaxID=44745 RepID=A0A6A0A379_HAELA|nr:uncharacterized protein HaLaN_21887 [Haematococcus lacustris]
MSAHSLACRGAPAEVFGIAALSQARTVRKSSVMNTPPAPYSLRLDPETARELATVGAALLLLDVPVGTLIGIDQQCFAAGPLFKGVKMLPPGPHFITYSAVSAHTASASPATGFFLHALPHAVYVKRWNSTTESLEALPEAEAERFAAGVRRFDFDSGMAPYNLHGLAAWSELCSCLTPELVDRLVPVSGVISVACEAAELDLSQPKTPAEQRGGAVAPMTEGSSTERLGVGVGGWGRRRAVEGCCSREGEVED